MGEEIEECQQLGFVLLGRNENRNDQLFQNEWISCRTQFTLVLEFGRRN
jgi:hypothetical protein